MILKIADFFKTSWFWFFAGLILLIVFVSTGHSFSQVFYFVTFLLPVVIGTSYYVNMILIPEYLLRKKMRYFVLYLIYTIVISLYLQYLIIFSSLIIYTYFQLGNESLLTMDINNLSLILYLLVLVKVVVEIVRKLNQKEIQLNSLREKVDKATAMIPASIMVRYNRENHPLELTSIIYIESLSDYIRIVTMNSEVVTKERISKIIERLPDHFQRTHRSFIVNSHKVSSFNREFITIEDHQIPISRTYKKDVISYLTQ